MVVAAPAMYPKLGRSGILCPPSECETKDGQFSLVSERGNKSVPLFQVREYSPLSPRAFFASLQTSTSQARHRSPEQP